MRHLIFVYGTLRRGEPGHRVLGAAGARFVGQACSEPGWALVDLGAWPGLVREGTGAVHGELFEVDEAELGALDAYEDCPRSYTRQSLRLSDGAQALAYVLVDALAEGRPRIAGGDWTARRHRITPR